MDRYIEFFLSLRMFFSVYEESAKLMSIASRAEFHAIIFLGPGHDLKLPTRLSSGGDC